MKITLLQYLAARNLAERMQKLLDKGGTGVNKKDSEGKTALHHASKNGALNTFKILYECPYVNKKLVNKKGQTALDMARENGHDNIVACVEELERKSKRGAVKDLSSCLPEVGAVSIYPDTDASGASAYGSEAGATGGLKRPSSRLPQHTATSKNTHSGQYSDGTSYLMDQLEGHDHDSHPEDPAKAPNLQREATNSDSDGSDSSSGSDGWRRALRNHFMATSSHVPLVRRPELEFPDSSSSDAPSATSNSSDESETEGVLNARVFSRHPKRPKLSVSSTDSGSSRAGGAPSPVGLCQPELRGAAAPAEPTEASRPGSLHVMVTPQGEHACSTDDDSPTVVAASGRSQNVLETQSRESFVMSHT